MATCRECFHYEVCAEWAEDIFGKDNEFPYEEETGERLCEHYTPKSDYVKRERGEWICLDADVGYSEEKCSICGYIDVVDENDTRNFCPNCGADMRKEDNNA